MRPVHKPGQAHARLPHPADSSVSISVVSTGTTARLGLIPSYFLIAVSTAPKALTQSAQPFVFNCPSFAAMNVRMSSDRSKSLSHCSLYKVTGKRPIP